MISKEEYDFLQDQHKEASRKNDYSKMMMIGDDNWKKCNVYEQEFVCKHSSVTEHQGGQIEECTHCGKRWS